MRFYLWDRLTELLPWQRVVAIKNVGAGDEMLLLDQGRGLVMPQVLVAEAVAQALGALVVISTDFSKRALLTSMGRLECGLLPRPGDQLTLCGEIETWLEDALFWHGQAQVGEDMVVAIGSATAALVGAPQLEPPEVTRRFYLTTDQNGIVERALAAVRAQAQG